MLRCVDNVSGFPESGFWLVCGDERVFIYGAGIASADGDMFNSPKRELSVEEVLRMLERWKFFQDGKLSIPDRRKW